MDGGFSLNEGGEREKLPSLLLGGGGKGWKRYEKKDWFFGVSAALQAECFFFALQKFPQKISEHKKLKNTARIKKMFCNSFNLLYVCKHIVSISLLKMKFAAKKLCLGNTSPILSSPS